MNNLIDGFWQAKFWSPDIWIDGFWQEIGRPQDGGKKRKKKKHNTEEEEFILALGGLINTINEQIH